jgi:hypothetical protein
MAAHWNTLKRQLYAYHAGDRSLSANLTLRMHELSLDMQQRVHDVHTAPELKTWLVRMMHNSMEVHTCFALIAPAERIFIYDNRHVDIQDVVAAIASNIEALYAGRDAINVHALKGEFQLEGVHWGTVEFQLGNKTGHVVAPHGVRQDIHFAQAALQQLSYLAAPNDPSGLDSGLLARYNRYSGDLKQLRADKASLEARLATAELRRATAESERDAALDSARSARNALSQLKQDIAREKATTERIRVMAERNRTETAEERTERVRDEKFHAADRERFFSAL